MTNEKTAKIRTFCKGCVFKTVKPNDLQEGCQLGRLDTFIEQGTYVHLEDGYYIIDRLCSACRDETWAKDKVDPIVSVSAEVAPKIDYIIDCNEPEPNLKKIKRTLFSIQNQHIEPKNILVSVKKNANLIYKELSDCGYSVRVTQSILDDYVDSLIDICLRQCDGSFYTLINAGEELDPTYSMLVHHLINVKLQNFVILETSEKLYGYPTLIFSKIHKMLNGNKGGSLIEKVRQLDKIQESNMLKKWEDVIKT